LKWKYPCSALFLYTITFPHFQHCCTPNINFITCLFVQDSRFFILANRRYITFNIYNVNTVMTRWMKINKQILYMYLKIKSIPVHPVICEGLYFTHTWKSLWVNKTSLTRPFLLKCLYEVGKMSCHVIVG